MADSVASTQSRPQRAASKKRRQATVPTETENKLARAARSAQRLAQLSDASRNDGTLELFPDDPTRATVEAMNIDIRQGTLHGFELPDVVLAAVGAIDTGDSTLLEARAARRVPRPAKSDEPMPVHAQLSGLEIEPMAALVSPADELVAGDVAGDMNPAVGANAEDKPMALAPDASMPLTPAMAAATVARSVTALRQASAPGVNGDAVATSTPVDGRPPQGFAATFAKAATASREAAAAGSVDKSTGSDLIKPGSPESADALAESEQGAEAPVDGSASAQISASLAQSDSASTWADTAWAQTSIAPTQTDTAFAEPWREARRAEAAAAALRAAPELDRARATAFADTVDALYGVIADQRLAATDHSRRMKWMLSIVVGALLVTVAIGITETVLLMRLTRETTGQQHRIEQLMQNQQAAMVSLLDTRTVTANAAAAAATSAAAAAAAPAASQPAVATPAHGKRAARAQHLHKPKAVNSH